MDRDFAAPQGGPVPDATSPKGDGPPAAAATSPTRTRHGAKKRLCVVKIGTSSLMTDDSRVKLPSISRLVETIISLRKEEHNVVLVSSGAQGCGRIKLGLTAKKPATVAEKQAVAAAGQSYLMRIYEDLFDTASGQRQKIAQLLVTRRDFSSFSSFENIKNTVNQLLAYGVIPVINENDSVHPTTGLHEKFGDNDALAALTAVNLDADWLFLMTDVDYVYTHNPFSESTKHLAKPIFEVKSMEELQTVGVEEGGTSTWGTGGMATKLVAARMASCAGIKCVLVNGKEPERILGFFKAWEQEQAELNGSGATAAIKNEKANEKASPVVQAPDAELRAVPAASLMSPNGVAPVLDEPASSARNIGTFFHAIPSASTLKYQRRWILALPPKGRLIINPGAADALNSKKSLLAVGILDVEGDFHCGDCVHIVVRDVAPTISDEAWERVERKNHEEGRGTTALLEQGGKNSMLRASASSPGDMALMGSSTARAGSTSRGGQASGGDRAVAQHMLSQETAGSTNSSTSRLLASSTISSVQQDVGQRVSQRDNGGQKRHLPTADVDPDLSEREACLSSDEAKTVAIEQARGRRLSAKRLQERYEQGNHDLKRGDSKRSSRSTKNLNAGAAGEKAPNSNAKVLAQGLVEFTSDELRKIRGVRSNMFEKHLGYVADPEVCHRENIILIGMPFEIAPRADPRLSQCVECGEWYDSKLRLEHDPNGPCFFQACADHEAAQEKRDESYPTCAGCGRSKAVEQFSKCQWKKKTEDRRCKACQNAREYENALRIGMQRLRKTFAGSVLKTTGRLSTTAKVQGRLRSALVFCLLEVSRSYFWDQWDETEEGLGISSIWVEHKKDENAARNKPKIAEDFKRLIVKKFQADEILWKLVGGALFWDTLVGVTRAECALVTNPNASSLFPFLCQSETRKPVADYVKSISDDYGDRLWKIREHLLHKKVMGSIIHIDCEHVEVDAESSDADDQMDPVSVKPYEFKDGTQLTPETVGALVHDRLLENSQNAEYFPAGENDVHHTWIAEILYHLLYSAIGVGDTSLRNQLVGEVGSDDTVWAAKAHEVSDTLTERLQLEDSARRYMYRSFIRFLDDKSDLSVALQEGGEPLATTELIGKLLQKPFARREGYSPDPAPASSGGRWWSKADGQGGNRNKWNANDEHYGAAATCKSAVMGQATAANIFGSTAIACANATATNTNTVIDVQAAPDADAFGGGSDLVFDPAKGEVLRAEADHRYGLKDGHANPLVPSWILEDENGATGTHVENLPIASHALGVETPGNGMAGAAESLEDEAGAATPGPPLLQEQTAIVPHHVPSGLERADAEEDYYDAGVMEIVGEIVTSPELINLLASGNAKRRLFLDATEIRGKLPVRGDWDFCRKDFDKGAPKLLGPQGDFEKKDLIRFISHTDGGMAALWQMMDETGRHPVREKERANVLDKPSAYIYFGPWNHVKGRLIPATDSLPNFTKMINHMLRAEAKRADLPLEYTHIGALWNNKTKAHSDGRNAGDSYLIGGGSYTGGCFCRFNPDGEDQEADTRRPTQVITEKGKGITWMDKNGDRQRVEEKEDIWGDCVDLKYKMVKESGQPPHWTDDFEGDRFLVVAWVDGACRIEEGSDLEKELRAAGFENFPTKQPRETDEQHEDDADNDAATAAATAQLLGGRARKTLKPRSLITTLPEELALEEVEAGTKKMKKAALAKSRPASSTTKKAPKKCAGLAMKKRKAQADGEDAGEDPADAGGAGGEGGSRNKRNRNDRSAQGRELAADEAVEDQEDDLLA
eukprot:g3326.t1